MLQNGFHITLHAQEEMGKRQITIDAIWSCLKNPDQIIRSQETRVIYQSKIKSGEINYLLRIIVENETSPKRVITVYRTSKIEKYWKE
ncbi:MAG: DUF4258 domain-containing protein [Bacteriovorax sp.]|nr:DUF4258 domain-containing protein [Bacteriovorax sp.]